MEMIFKCIVSAFLFLNFLCCITSTKMETHLRRNLTDSYDGSARPVLDDNETVNVNVELILRQLITINEKEEYIELAVWSRIKWQDPRLVWDRDQFNGIKKLNFRSDELWVPDITLYNYAQDAVDFGGNMDTMNTRIVVSYTGHILWMAPIILKATCKIKVNDFPFDIQHCFFKFGSWTFDMSRLNVSCQQMVTEFYTKNQEWHLHHHECVRTEVNYPGDCPGENCTSVYPDVTFHLHFQRKPLFFNGNLVFPIFLITFLTIFALLLPTESGDRISTAVTMMLAVIVFLHLVADLVPESSDAVPKLKMFFFFCLALIFLIIVSMYVATALHHRGIRRKPMGKWVKEHVYNKLAFKLLTRHDICLCGDGEQPIGDQEAANSTNGSTTSGDKNAAKATVFHSCAVEWQVVAATLDRILFIFFFVIFFIGCLAILYY